MYIYIYIYILEEGPLLWKTISTFSCMYVGRFPTLPTNSNLELIEKQDGMLTFVQSPGHPIWQQRISPRVTLWVHLFNDFRTHLAPLCVHLDTFGHHFAALKAIWTTWDPISSDLRTTWATSTRNNSIFRSQRDPLRALGDPGRPADLTKT